MNLRASYLGLILVSALTFFSCEEDISTIGLPPENNLGIFFADIPLGENGAQLWVDQVNSQGTGAILVGRYDDPDLGLIEAKNFSEFILNRNVLFDTLLNNASFDSLVYSLRISDFTGVNFEGQTQTFELYQLQEPIDLIKVQNGDTSAVSFYTSSEQALASKVGEASFLLYPDSVNLTFADSDFPLLTEADSAFKDKFFDAESVYIYRHDMKLNNSFGLSFFNQARSGDSFESGEAFAEFFKGLAILPSANNSAIVQYFAGNSSLKLYFTKNGKSESVSFSVFQTNSVSQSRTYNNIAPNINNPWMSGALSGISTYEPFETFGNELYLQSGTNLMLNLDLSGLRQFEDSLGSAVIQSAQLRVGTIDVSPFLETNSAISMGLTSKDSLENRNYFVEPLLNNRNTSRLTFDEEIPGYKTDIPLYAESLTSDDVDYDQLTLFLGNISDQEPFPTSAEVKKVIVDKNNLILRVYYTIPDKNN